jgi:hypothetical protein
MLFAKNSIVKRRLLRKQTKDHKQLWKNHKERVSKPLLTVQQAIRLEPFQYYLEALPAENSFQKEAIASSTIFRLRKRESPQKRFLNSSHQA